jgi:hypothetical protein
MKRQWREATLLQRVQTGTAAQLTKLKTDGCWRLLPQAECGDDQSPTLRIED